MTRGYYVLEMGNKILEAAYLSGDAYLCEGYGEKIIRAFSENKETEYLHQLIAEMTDYDQEKVTDLVPECYRITKKSEDRPFVDYSYVLKNNTLRVYYYGKLMFVIRKETADKWLDAVRHEKGLYKHYLYSTEKLRTLYEKQNVMWKQLQEKFDSGSGLTDDDVKPQEYAGMELSDEHCVDVWYRYEAPAYVKILTIQGIGDIKFIVNYSYHNWVACIQLPYCRIGVLNGHSFKTETAAMKKLRDFIREKSEQLKEFAIICNKYRELVQAFQIGKKDLKNRLIDKKDFNGHVQELCEYLNTHVWFAMGSYMSKDRILSELRGIYDRELPELEEK